ncbi:Fe2+-dependent dioxygenase [Uliginosibacterium sp. sgz301328]|uniref:Fe2+-dependent dioxygenase n=1 Tax=Uliginosibacterium sp. sgz301328 TaxID=3243764 RepID=UPI00359EEBD7
MLLHVPNVLSAEELAELRGLLSRTQWADGRITAGSQSGQVKYNMQVPEGAAELPVAREIVLRAMERNGLLFSGALPFRTFPPLFNRYGNGMHFGAHVDKSVRVLPGIPPVRTDVSATLFLADPESYDGGELVIQDTYGEHSIKLPAGDMIVYPGTSLHRVEPVTRGERLACFTWMQSMVRDDNKRALLFEMDMAIATLRGQIGDVEALISLTSNYHNLLRMWAEV